MYPFSQSVTPAVRTHIDAQTAFMNDLSKAIFHSFQRMFDLNIQLVQTLLEETTTASQQLMAADRQTEMLSAAASRAQPITEKLRAYQQHVSRVLADSQVEIARVAEQHVQNTSKTAQTLADEVARNASEETARGMRTQQENVRHFADPFARAGEGMASQAQMWAGTGTSTLQSAGQQAVRQGVQQAGNMQDAGMQQAGNMQHSAMQQAGNMQQAAGMPFGSKHGDGGATAPSASTKPGGGSATQ
jgi:phasin family protein